MILLVAAAMLAAGDNGLAVRHDFVDCLKQASADAKTHKIAPDGFVAFAHSNCASAEASFKQSLVQADVSHGMSRKESDSDAASQIDDYYSDRLDNFKFQNQASATANVPPKPQ